jgi:mono/diheme cytochrome c family protein
MLRRLLRSGMPAIVCCSLIACKAQTPGPFETKTATWVKHHITVGGKAERNPLPATAANIDAGKHVFSYYCIACHGRDGQNTGVPFARKLEPPVPSMASAEVQAYSDGQLKWIIDNGLFPSGMPASRGTLANEEIWQIIAYLRHLPPAGSLGDPKAYGGDEYEPETGASQQGRSQ